MGVAAISLGVSAFSHSWWSGGSEEGFGLTSVRECKDSHSHCETLSYSALEKAGADVADLADLATVWFGRAAFGLILATSVLCAAYAAFLALQNPKRVPYVMLAGIVSALSVAGFVLQVNEFLKLVPFGMGFYLYGFGVAVAIVADQLLDRVPINASASRTSRGPSAPRPPPPPPHQVGPQPPVPACPRCSAPTVWVAQYQRHFCPNCRHYL